jgi:1,2-diacylglycerol 3-alpha-glucosyltransferase
MLSKSRSAKPVIAIVWTSFAPYHLARCRAVVKACKSDYAVLGVEVARTTAGYDWTPVSEDVQDFKRVRLFECGSERVPLIGLFRAMRRLLSQRNVAAVLLPSYWPPPNLALLAAVKSARVPVVMMNDSHDGTARARGIAHGIKVSLARSFDASIVGGARHKRYYTSLGCPGERVFTGYDAVDNELFIAESDRVRSQAPQSRHSFGLPDRYFLSLGRFVPKKNLVRIVESYAALKRSRLSSPALVFVGSGEGEAELIARANQLGLRVVDHKSTSCDQINGDVHLFPFKQITDIPAFYALADAFILASLEEEWGLVVNEAMAAGIPVIVSSRAGCAEDLVHHGTTGLLFDPTSTLELTECLASITEDPEAARKMGNAARAHIESFSCDAFGHAVRKAVACVAPNSNHNAADVQSDLEEAPPKKDLPERHGSASERHYVFRRRRANVLAIPIANRKVMLSAAGRFQPFTAKRALYRTMMQGAVLAGIPYLALRNRQEFDVEAFEPLEDWMAQVSADTGCGARYSTIAWPPHADRRRLYAHLLSGSGTPVAFAKLSLNGLNDIYLQREEAALRAVCQNLRKPWHVPRVLSSGTWNGRRYLVTEPLPNGSGPPGARNIDVRGFCEAVGGHIRDLSPEADERKLWPQPRSDGSNREYLEMMGAATIGARRAHGDLWINNIVASKDELWVVDWEYSVPLAPALADEVGFWARNSASAIAQHPARMAVELKRHFESRNSTGEFDILAALLFWKDRELPPAMKLLSCFETSTP